MNELIKMDSVSKRIFWVRNMQVMPDSDLAELYEVETKNLNRAVSRNMARFPEKFRFQLTKEEFENLRFRNGTSSVVSQNSPRSEPQHGGRRYLPYVFSEQGVAMLSAVLRSETAVQISIQIMQAFVELRHFVQDNAHLLREINRIKTDQISLRIETDKKFEQVFDVCGRKDEVGVEDHSAYK